MNGRIGSRRADAAQNLLNEISTIVDFGYDPIGPPLVEAVHSTITPLQWRHPAGEIFEQIAVTIHAKPDGHHAGFGRMLRCCYCRIYCDNDSDQVNRAGRYS